MTHPQGYADRARRLLIAGNYGYGNLGDEAILSGVLATVRHSHPETAVVVVSGNPTATAELHGVPAVFWELPELGSAIDDCDAVLLGGGGLLHDYGEFDPAGISNGDSGHLSRYFRAVSLATSVGRPLGMLSLGIGPFRSATSAMHTRLAFEQNWRGTVRDEHSLTELERLGADTTRVTVAPDPAFALQAPPDPHVRARREAIAGTGIPLVLVAVRPWNFGPPAEQWTAALAQALDRFVDETDAAVRFLPFQVKTPGDVQIAEVVRRQMRHADHTDSVADVRTVGTLMEHIAAADLVVGMRLHSLILAQVCGVPAVGLSYDPKVAAHCSTASEPPAVALEEMTPDTVFGALRHAWDSRSEVRQRLARERPVKAAAAAAGIEVLVRLTDGSLPRPRRLSDASAALATEVAQARWRASGNDPAAGDTRGTPTPQDDVVLCFGIIPWEFRWQRPQQMLTAWARQGRRVFLVRGDRSSPGGDPWVTVRLLADRVWEVLLSLPAPCGPFESAASDELTESAIDALRVLKERFAIDSAFSVVQAPGWTRAAIAARQELGWKVLYDCMDDWAHFPGFATRSDLLQLEEELVRAADAVSVTSRVLYDRWARIRPDALIVPNAADPETYSREDGADPIPEVRAPVAGFIGAIAEWFDRELLELVAQRCPDVSFVLVGGVHRVDVARLARLPNVRFEGARPYPMMPAYVRRFDVCLLPFIVSPLTDGVDPVKLHEYFSLGKPVVSTNFAAVREYRDLLYLAEDVDAFANQLRNALAERDPNLQRRRIDHAWRHSWTARVQQIDTAMRTPTDHRADDITV